jgi:hypothetical protein
VPAYPFTLARNAMMEMRCSEGWRLNSTTSPSSRCRSTTQPTCSGGSVAVKADSSIVVASSLSVNAELALDWNASKPNYSSHQCSAA